MAEVNVGLRVRMEAKPVRENDVEEFFKGGLALFNEEPETNTWFGVKLGPTTFGIFDTFPGGSSHDAHLSGRVAEALMANAPDLPAEEPSIEKLDILASKLP